MTQVNDTTPSSFESALENAKKIIDRMEANPTLSIEASINDFKKAKQLLEFCQIKLNNAEQEINIVCQNQSETTIKPYQLAEETTTT